MESTIIWNLMSDEKRPRSFETVILAVRFRYGEPFSMTGFLIDGVWHNELQKKIEGVEVVGWATIPQPTKEFADKIRP